MWGKLLQLMFFFSMLSLVLQGVHCACNVESRELLGPDLPVYYGARMEPWELIQCKWQGMPMCENLTGLLRMLSWERVRWETADVRVRVCYVGVVCIVWITSIFWGNGSNYRNIGLVLTAHVMTMMWFCSDCPVRLPSPLSLSLSGWGVKLIFRVVSIQPQVKKKKKKRETST